ncbi:MAG TPA: hypothetical protein VNK04_08595 [Gemmataceae bacterium]|nr:hypothetical protein [Gemmataceae bacterium]
MANNPIVGLDLAARLRRRPEECSHRVQGLYRELSKLDNLQLAYAQIRKGAPNLGVNTRTWETVEEGVKLFLQQLSSDLQARTYRPGECSNPLPATNAGERPGLITLRDLVVQAPRQ